MVVTESGRALCYGLHREGSSAVTDYTVKAAQLLRITHRRFLVTHNTEKAPQLLQITQRRLFDTYYTKTDQNRSTIVTDHIKKFSCYTLHRDDSSVAINYNSVAQITQRMLLNFYRLYREGVPGRHGRLPASGGNSHLPSRPGCVPWRGGVRPQQVRSVHLHWRRLQGQDGRLWCLRGPLQLHRPLWPAVVPQLRLCHLHQGQLRLPNRSVWIKPPSVMG